MVLVFKHFPLYGVKCVHYHLTETAKAISFKDINSSRKKKSFLSRAGGGLLLCTLKCLLCSKKILGSVDGQREKFSWQRRKPEEIHMQTKF